MSRQESNAKNATRVRRRLAVAVALLAVIPAASVNVACADPPQVVERSSANARSGDSPSAVRVATFETPVEVRVAPGFRRLMFVVEQAGRVMVLHDGRKLRTPFLDIRGRVRDGGEQGLLSIAFPADYARSRIFYVYFTDSEGDIRVEQYRRATAVRANRQSARRIIEIPHRYADNHNGGQMHFLGSTLYFGTGDGGGLGDPEDNAQDPDSLLGKMIAIQPTASGSLRYRIPSGNPFRGVPGRDEIFAIGLRNPFRWSFDLRDPDRPMIALADVGEGDWEELNYLPVSEARGANFGWNAWEGPDVFNGPEIPGTVVPELSLSHGDGYCSIIGGPVARDPGLPAIRGRILFSDFCRSGVESVPAVEGSGSGASSAGVSVGEVTSFVETAGRRIFLTSMSGGLYRLSGG